MSDVLIYHNILWSHYKGRVFSELNRLCTQQGIACYVVHFALSERQRASLGDVEYSLHEYPYALLSNGAYDDLSTRVKVLLALKALKQHDPRVIVLPGYWDPAYWAILMAARIQGRKVIVACDSTELDHRRTWSKEFLKRQFIRHCQGGFAYGIRAKNYLVKLGMPEKRITIRCQAASNTDLAFAFRSAQPDRRRFIAELDLCQRNFCYVGRLSPEKNVPLLIKAFARLRMMNRNARDWGLLIVGDGPDRESLVELAKHENIPNARFVGGVGWRQVPRYLAICDVLVLPSSSEPWGLVVNEAMVCGLPVLVSNRCGCVEDLVIEGVTGHSFDCQDVDALAKRMEYFVDSPDRIAEYGRNAKSLIDRYSPYAAASQMVHGLQDLLQADAA